MKIALLSVFFTSCAVLLPDPVRAAEPDPTQTGAPGKSAAADHDGLEVIVVTALRRSESLQDVPASVTAMTGQDLAEMGATNYQSFLNTVPGVAFTDDGYRSRVTIRGIASPVNLDPPIGATTAIYIDDAPISELQSQSFDPSLYDVERVEVLRGPQGTLYGASSLGGAVRIILNKPEMNALEMDAASSVGAVSHGGTHYRLDSVLNAPLVSDRAAVRLAVGYQNIAGFIDDTGVGGSDTNHRTRKSARLAFLLTPTDSTSIYLNGLYQRDVWDGLPFASGSSDNDYSSHQGYSQGGLSEAKLFGLTLTQDFGWMSLVSVTNYLSKDHIESSDGTATLAPIVSWITGIPFTAGQGLGLVAQVPYDVFTQEIRLASQGTQRVHWLLGGFYSRSHSVRDQIIPLDQLPQFAAAYGSPNGLYQQISDTRRRQIAAFGELTYDITERWSVTAGVRASDLTQRYIGTGFGLLNGGDSYGVERASSKPVTRKFLTKLELSEDSMVYAQAAQGFREGSGVAPVPFNICGDDLRQLGFNDAPTQYGPDKLWSYEVGSKSTFSDRRVSLGAAVYYIDWSGIQQDLNLPTCQFSVIVNAGAAVSKGFEVEASVHPTRNLTLSANVSLADAILHSFPVADPGFIGNRLPLGSKWQGGVAGQYEFDLPNGVSAFLRSDASYVGPRWNVLQGQGADIATQMPSYSLVNFRAGVRRGNWELALYATNATDERVVMYRSLYPQIHDTLAEPRVIGLSAKYQM